MREVGVTDKLRNPRIWHERGLADGGVGALKNEVLLSCLAGTCLTNHDDDLVVCKLLPEISATLEWTGGLAGLKQTLTSPDLAEERSRDVPFSRTRPSGRIRGVSCELQESSCIVGCGASL